MKKSIIGVTFEHPDPDNIDREALASAVEQAVRVFLGKNARVIDHTFVSEDDVRRRRSPIVGIAMAIPVSGLDDLDRTGAWIESVIACAACSKSGGELTPCAIHAATAPGVDLRADHHPASPRARSYRPTRSHNN